MSNLPFILWLVSCAIYVLTFFFEASPEVKLGIRLFACGSGAGVMLMKVLS